MYKLPGTCRTNLSMSIADKSITLPRYTGIPE